MKKKSQANHLYMKLHIQTIFFSKVSHPADTSVSLSMIKKNTQKYGYFTVSTYVSTETSPYKKHILVHPYQQWEKKFGTNNMYFHM